MMKRVADSSELGILVHRNIRLARRLTNRQLGTMAIERLRDLTKTFGFSLTLGDVQYLYGGWYITHAGLLRLSRRRRCSGIRVHQVRQLCDPVMGRWVFKATVYPYLRSKGFVGFGDADPSNVSSLVHGAEMRVAETRAVNRALRKAYGIGLCSVEELGWAPRSNAPAPPVQRKASSNENNGHQNGQPRLRDRLCLLIRQYHLDAGLVKAYAADFCNTPSLREATKEQVQAFIDELARRAANDLPGLICQLSSYAKPQEVES
jgi:hypothetical protein